MKFIFGILIFVVFAADSDSPGKPRFTEKTLGSSSEDPLKSVINRLQKIVDSTDLFYLREDVNQGFMTKDEAIEEILGYEFPTLLEIEMVEGIMKNLSEIIIEFKYRVIDAQNLLNFFGEINRMGVDPEELSTESLKKELAQIAKEETIQKLASHKNEFIENLEKATNGSIDFKILMTGISTLIHFQAPRRPKVSFTLIQKSLEVIRLIKNQKILKMSDYMKTEYSKYISGILEGGKVYKVLKRASLSEDEAKLLKELQDLSPEISCDGSIDIPKAPSLSASLNAINQSLNSLSSHYDDLDTLLSDPELDQMFRDLIEIGSEAIRSSDDTIHQTKLQGYQGLPLFKEKIKGISGKIEEIQGVSTGIQEDAEDGILEDLDSYIVELQKHSEFFKCIGELKPLEPLDDLEDRSKGILQRLRSAREEAPIFLSLIMNSKGEPDLEAIGIAIKGLVDMWNALDKKDQILEHLKSMDHLDVATMYVDLESFRSSPLDVSTVFEEAQKVKGLKIDSDLDLLNSLDFSRYHGAFAAAQLSLNTFLSGNSGEEEECSGCPGELEFPVLYLDPLAITLSSSLTFSLFAILFVLNRRRRPLENVDTVEMTEEAVTYYFQSTHDKIHGHKTSLRADEPTPIHFYRYFNDISNTSISWSTRIKLKDHNFPDDFVDANMVHFPSGLRMIMTGRPQELSDVEKFWWIAKQENVDKVVMLCPLTVIDGIPQHVQYYPRFQGDLLEFNNLKIKNLKMELKGRIVVRRLSVEFRGEPKFYVTHYLYGKWSENENQQDLKMIYVLLCEVRTSLTPVMVHCSDGVGRTGCFGYIEMAYQMLKREGKVDFGDVLDLMRFQRAGVILSAEQYGFCAYAIGFYILEDNRRLFKVDPKILHELSSGYENWDLAEIIELTKMYLMVLRYRKKISST
uniref:WSN domain-containing protein n=1 Tax=Caenorhabditis tropicalis TaxID=1561998 RepID=A0A1I7UTB5_9PELO